MPEEKEHKKISTNQILNVLVKLTDILENIDIELSVAKITLEEVSTKVMHRSMKEDLEEIDRQNKS